MVWRSWSVIAVLLLANYLVFSTLATFVFPPPVVIPPTHAAQVTFTPGLAELRSVGTLTYDFLTPTALPTSTSTVTATLTVPATGAARGTAVPTRAP